MVLVDVPSSCKRQQCAGCATSIGGRRDAPADPAMSAERPSRCLDISVVELIDHVSHAGRWRAPGAPLVLQRAAVPAASGKRAARRIVSMMILSFAPVGGPAGTGAADRGSLLPSADGPCPPLRLQLVLINISDHHTRTRANTGAAPGAAVRVLGCLLGSQAGRTVDIANSFEMRLKAGGGEAEVDEAFLQKKMEQCEWKGRGGCGFLERRPYLLRSWCQHAAAHRQRCAVQCTATQELRMAANATSCRRPAQQPCAARVASLPAAALRKQPLYCNIQHLRCMPTLVPSACRQADLSAAGCSRLVRHRRGPDRR